MGSRVIPAHTWLKPPHPAPFLPPEGAQDASETVVVMGGTSIGNGNDGRQVKEWRATLVAGVTTVTPVGGGEEWVAATHGAETISLAFDNNMNPVLAYQVGSSSNLYYYSTLAQAYDTLVVPGTSSCRVCVDDAREIAQVISDVIFAYTTGSAMFWREQRDRYEVARKVGDTTGKIKRMGMNEERRMQIEVWS